MTEQPTPSPGATWPQQRRVLVLAVAIDAALAALLVLSGWQGLLRGTAVFLFFLLGPGLAVTGFLRFQDAVAELAVAIPLSLALSTAVAAWMSLMTTWRPDVALVGSVFVTVPLLAGQAWPAGRAPTEPQTEPRLPAPAEPAESDRPAPAVRVAVPAVRLPASGRAPVNGHPTGAPVNGGAARTPAKRLGDGPEPAGRLPEEIGVGLIGLARREIRTDSAAVVIPDAGTWMVISGTDLPDRAEALRITAAHQLIRDVLFADRPRIIPASERTPLDLAGLPLAASDHLLALPLPKAKSVIVLSRSHPPFHPEELRLLRRTLDLPATMLDLAVRMQSLGEALDGVLDGPAAPAGLRRDARGLTDRQPGPERGRT